jgi:hypothetical protein
MFVIVLVMCAVLTLSVPTWRVLRERLHEHWRWMLVVIVSPWMIAGALAGIVLVVELFDPNWPAPRDAVATTRIIWPWSRERVQPKQIVRARLPGTIDFSLDDK